MNDDSITNITEQNRRAWNEIAEVRSQTFPSAAFFSSGGSTLSEVLVIEVLRIFDSLKGLRLIHLQCATGEDTLSWAGMGAEAVGVDISDEQITLAKRKTSEAGMNVRFIAADIYQLPGALPEGWYKQGFDIVFTGGGAIVWLPDLDNWAKVVASLLRPGGLFILHEEHPLGSCIWSEDGQLQVIDDYFRRGTPTKDNGWYHFKGGENAREFKYEYIWPVGDVITALAQAGLIIERLSELPGGPEWRILQRQDQVVQLPGQYFVAARKPRGLETL